jgi:hypothetical protein
MSENDDFPFSSRSLVRDRTHNTSHARSSYTYICDMKINPTPSRIDSMCVDVVEELCTFLVTAVEYASGDEST